MEIAFDDDELEKLCSNAKYAARKLGAISAKKLQSRLADIVAAHNVTELVAGKPHPLKGDRIGCLSIALHRGHRLVLRPDHDPAPSLEDGGTDWRRVTAVRVVEIGDYH
ncbi:MAG: killer suppression protein HigA [Gammaproteobacteria bacterium]|nr:killer suppression protein HigA [Gammaproteobacteria bacterium]MYE29674.1 killer suppression protein HigA [Gammaproteobacteria bacterium]